MRKVLVGAAVAAGLLGGSVAVAAVNPLSLAGAQDPASTDPPPTTAAPQPPADPGTDPRKDGPHRGHKGDRGEVLKQTLDELVAKGTITQAQEDAILEALKAKIGDHRGKRGPGFGFPDIRDMADTVAGAIGIDVETLKTELEGGKSIADVAQAHGVDPQVVIDAIVAKIDAKIDEAVAAGKIPADRAAQIKQQVPEHVAKMVNGHFKGKGPWGPPGGPIGPPVSPPGDPSDPTDPTPPTTKPGQPAPAPSPPTTKAPGTTGTTTAPSRGSTTPDQHQNN